MAERKPMFRYVLVDGAPVSAGGMRVTPHARVLEVRWPGGGLAWNRPVAVTVERDGATTRMTPIMDVTRAAQLALGAFVALTWMLAAARAARRVRRGHE